MGFGLSGTNEGFSHMAETQHPRPPGPQPGPDESEVEPSVADIRLGRVFLLVATVAAVFATYVLHAALPVNALELPFESRDTIKQIMPEGWAFFTASPRTVYPQVYEHLANDWRAPGESLVVASGLFGLNRSQRAEGTEAALLMYQIPPESWSSCKTLPRECLSKLSITRTLRNDSTLRHFCGDIGFVNQEVLPWAWRRSGTVMPSMVIRVQVQC
jgi:antimicrobial peptide system SdpA family protein